MRPPGAPEIVVTEDAENRTLHIDFEGLVNNATVLGDPESQYWLAKVLFGPDNHPFQSSTQNEHGITGLSEWSYG